MMAIPTIAREIVIQRQFLGSPPAAEPGQSGIHGNAVEPRREGRLPPKRLRLLVNRQEDFLHDLFRLCLIADEPERLAIDRREMPLEQGIKGLVIASLHLCD